MTMAFEDYVTLYLLKYGKAQLFNHNYMDGEFELLNQVAHEHYGGDMVTMLERLRKHVLEKTGEKHGPEPQ